MNVCILAMARALILLPAMAMAAALPVPKIPAFPDHVDSTFSARLHLDGSYTWLDSHAVWAAGICGSRVFEAVINRWSPITGQTDVRPIGLRGFVTAQAAIPDGWLVLVLASETGCATDKHMHAGFLSEQGAQTLLPTELAAADGWARMLAMSPSSAALITLKPDTRHLLVRIIRHAGTAVQVEEMPELAIAYNHDFAQAMLDPDHLMILGGSDAKYRGCMPCRAETHVLDIPSKSWSAGPSMQEARSEMDATRLPDGSVLVSGGWTKKADWNTGPSRSVERWNPRTNQFEAAQPMPSANVGHHGIWMPGSEGEVLLMVNGHSAGVQAYDVRTGRWHGAGAWRFGNDTAGNGFIPFQFNGHVYAWRRGEPWELGPLLSEHAPTSLSADDTDSVKLNLNLNQYGAAFLPAGKGQAALIIGGATGVRINGTSMTSAVASIDTNGGMAALPDMNQPRENGQAVRIDGGVLVVGGIGEKPFDGKTPDIHLSPEWLDLAHPSQWLQVQDSSLTTINGLSELANGHLLALCERGRVSEMNLHHDGASLTLERTAWPSLNDERFNLDYVHISQLNDGRVIVAGGDISEAKIVLLASDTEDLASNDQYVGVGERVPARTYEIYSAISKQWTRSAVSPMEAGNLLILGDGRVVNMLNSPDQDGKSKLRIELSSVDGSSWSEFPEADNPALRPDGDFKAFVVDGELFATGHPSGTNGYTPSRNIFWFDAASEVWKAVWGDASNQRQFVQLKLANAKTVILPVEGL
ncbi:MAG: kelch repeat-containing protein [Dokdonella sp.]